MSQFLKSHFIIPGAAGKPVAADITWPEEDLPCPVVIYAHGFNGFKDWGGMNLVAEAFAAAGLAFLKFNFSHNGTTPEDPEEFTDLEAYGQNTYTKELEDLRAVTDWLHAADNPFAGRMDTARTGLIGHSRGGGIAIIGASEDPRIRALVTWASVSACKTPWGSWPPEKMEAWKHSGVAYTRNSRTGQDMPLRYSLYEDYCAHAARLDIEKAVGALSVPLLICHGTEDSSVPFTAAQTLHRLQPAAQLFALPTDHVFGRRHPWTEEHLPEPTVQLVDRTIQFLTDAMRN